jgi:hypothetical protein
VTKSKKTRAFRRIQIVAAEPIAIKTTDKGADSEARTKIRSSSN